MSDYKSNFLVAMVRFLKATDDASKVALEKADVKVRAASNKASFDVASVLAMFEGDDRGVLAKAIEEANEEVPSAMFEGRDAAAWADKAKEAYASANAIKAALDSAKDAYAALEAKNAKLLARMDEFAAFKVREALEALDNGIGCDDPDYEETVEEEAERLTTPDDLEGLANATEAVVAFEEAIAEEPSNVVQIKPDVTPEVVPVAADDGLQTEEEFKAARPHMSPMVADFAWKAELKARSLALEID